MSSIKTLLQEAEVYRSQGLMDEAMEKYRTASEMVANSGHLKNRKELMQLIQEKMDTLVKDTDQAKSPGKPAKMPKKSQDLIKNLSAYSKDLPKEQAAFEGAVALAKFGQYERALTEFNALLTSDALKVTAAKNIIRCHVALESLEKASRQYHQWNEDQMFSPEDLDTIRLLLETHLEKSGMKETLSDIPVQSPADSGNRPEKVEHMLDILSISFYQDHKSQKGRVYEFDISFQSGNLINFMVTSKDRSLIETFKQGDQIHNIQFFSPIAMFKSPGIISSIDPITDGPKKGEFSIDLTIVES